MKPHPPIVIPEHQLALVDPHYVLPFMLWIKTRDHPDKMAVRGMPLSLDGDSSDAYYIVLNPSNYRLNLQALIPDPLSWCVCNYKSPVVIYAYSHMNMNGWPVYKVMHQVTSLHTKGCVTLKDPDDIFELLTS